MMKRADTDMLVVVLKAFLGATAVKLLLAVPGGYRSTDFDVHANWLALTHGRPVKEWYWDETSQWTLDYPPLFAYFQRVLAVLAEALSIDPALLQQYENPPVWSSAAEGFLRGTVLASDATLFVGLAACIHGINGHAFKGEFIAKEAPGVLALMLFFNSGLLMVDHIHFQYNGILLGILLLSIGLVTQRRHILAGVVRVPAIIMQGWEACVELTRWFTGPMHRRLLFY
jgi:alpha-1,3-glucosyltransferase